MRRVIQPADAVQHLKIRTREGMERIVRIKRAAKEEPVGCGQGLYC